MDLQADKTSFEVLGITYEEKAFYDILAKVRDDRGFPYADEKCLVLAKSIIESLHKSSYAKNTSSDRIEGGLYAEIHD